MIAAIPRQDISGLWPVIEPYIDRALKFTFGEYKSNDVKDKAMDGHVIFFVVSKDGLIQSVISAEMVETPHKKYMNIVTTAGINFDEWIDDTVDTIIAVAKEQGAEDITMIGRKGWLRKMKKYGFKHKYTALTLTL